MLVVIDIDDNVNVSIDDGDLDVGVRTRTSKLACHSQLAADVELVAVDVSCFQARHFWDFCKLDMLVWAAPTFLR